MNIERWLYRLLDLKAKAQEIFPQCRVEISINEPGDYGLPIVSLEIYTLYDVEESLYGLDKVREWWLNMPYQIDSYVGINLSYQDYKEKNDV